MPREFRKRWEGLTGVFTGQGPRGRYRREEQRMVFFDRGRPRGPTVLWPLAVPSVPDPALVMENRPDPALNRACGQQHVRWQ